MRDKNFIILLLSLALRSLDRGDYGLGFFCSIEKAESPCRALVTLVDRNGERAQWARPVKNRCNLSYYTSHFSIRRTQSSHKSVRRTIWGNTFLSIYIQGIGSKKEKKNYPEQYFRRSILYYFAGKKKIC